MKGTLHDLRIVVRTGAAAEEPQNPQKSHVGEQSPCRGDRLSVQAQEGGERGGVCPAGVCSALPPYLV